MEIAFREDSGTRMFPLGKPIEGKAFFLDENKRHVRKLTVKLVRSFFVRDSIVKHGGSNVGKAMLKEDVLLTQEIVVPNEEFLEAGVPFSLTTRKEMRGSYASEFVELRYFVNVLAEVRKNIIGGIITSESVLKKKAEVTIGAPVCAAVFAGYSKPTRTNESRPFKKGIFFSGGTLNGTTVLTKAVYTLGENISSVVTVQNNTSEVVVDKIFMSVDEDTIFTGQFASSVKPQTLMVVTSHDLLEGGPLTPRTSRTFKVNIMVPLAKASNGIHPSTREEAGVYFSVEHYLTVRLLNGAGNTLLMVRSRIFLADVYKEALPLSTSPAHEHGGEFEEDEKEPPPPPRPPKNNATTAAAVAPLPPETENSNGNENLCVVCLSSPPTHVVVPCGHKCLCEVCTPSIEKMGKCPICQTPIQTIIKVYEA